MQAGSTMYRPSLLISVWIFVASRPIIALGLSSAPITETPTAQSARGRLAEAFRSASKKLTLHPEIVLPEPSDPTALLLRASEVTKLSEVLRTKAKANAVFAEGTVDALRPLGKEQEEARGNFPGPLPVIYSCTKSQVDACCGGGADNDDGRALEDLLHELKSVEGVEGVLIPFFGGTPIDVARYAEEAQQRPALKDLCSRVREADMQPIPEIALDPGADWPEEQVQSLVAAVRDTCGGLDPVSIIFSGAEFDKDASDDAEPLSIPKITIPKSISTQISFLGSIRTLAGGGRMNYAISELKKSNFQGAFLRSDCVPGYRLNPDLAAVGGFWSAAISDLKSLKSKNFSFRSKVKIEKDVPMEWYNYQKDVMDSGALGMPGGGGAGLDPSSGDYQGF